MGSIAPSSDAPSRLQPQRVEPKPAQWGVAAPSTSEQFKTRSGEHKPFALRWDHHFSPESASRTGSKLKDAFKHLANPNVISLGGGIPLSEYFPFEGVDFAVHPRRNLPESQGLGESVQLHSSKHDRANGSSIFDLSVALNYGQGSGAAQLLRWLTEHVEMVHNPPYRDWQCTMTIGNSSALDMALRMFTQRGDCVLADEFTFAAAIDTAKPMGVDFVGVKMDEQGMLPDSMRSVLENWDPAAHGGAKRPFLVYLVPTGQNPTGATQSLQRRKELYTVAQEFDLILMEDDPYYFLQLDARGSNRNVTPKPEDLLDMIIPSYLSIDVDGRVMRMDSFSKVVSPGARIGWLTASQQIVERYKSHADVSTHGPSGFSQLALFKLLDEHWGHAGFLEWLLHVRREYTERRDFMIDICNRHLPAEVATWSEAQAGMFQWIKVNWAKHPDAKTKSLLEIEEAIWAETIQHGALVARGSWFSVSQDEPLQDVFFRITFAAAPLDQIAVAVERFGKALKDSFKLDVDLEGPPDVLVRNP